MTSIACRNVFVAFDEVEVLHGVDLWVPPGGWVTVVGPNGAGKSTLLRAVGGMVEATGSIALGDRPLADLSRRELARLVALVPQEPVIPPGMRVVDYGLLGRTAGHCDPEPSHPPAFGWRTVICRFLCLWLLSPIP